MGEHPTILVRGEGRVLGDGLGGTVVMVITGLMLRFDIRFIQFLPKGVLDIALVIY